LKEEKDIERVDENKLTEKKKKLWPPLFAGKRTQKRPSLRAVWAGRGRS